MDRMKTSIVFAAILFIAPIHVLAQTAAGSIAGTVRDTTGAVLPGVIVEASSPALIEKVRAVVSDATGQYRIIDLRPGTYTVTFTLPGFGTVRREGIELTTGFTAPVSVELRVGDVSETVTVSGEAPVVDVQNTRTQAVMTRDVIDSIPTARTYSGLAALIPGINVVGLGAAAASNANQDVGGTRGFNSVVGIGLAIHGGRQLDQQMQIDGMPILSWANIYQASHLLSDANFQEYAIDVSGNSAEIESGGVRVNMIPREGGNTFRANFVANFSHPELQADNLTAAIRAQGLTAANRLKSQWQYSASLGGPIAKDKLWFFSTYTKQHNEQYVAGSYYNSDVAAWNYVPDLTRQAVDYQDGYDAAIRGTWQATSRNKLAGYFDYNETCHCNFQIGGATKIDASTYRQPKNQVRQATWTSPVTNRLLLEAGYSSAPQDQFFNLQPGAVAPRITDTGINAVYRSNQPNRQDMRNMVLRGSMSYVTGTHAMKVGFRSLSGRYRHFIREFPGNLEYTALNGVPTQVTYHGSPLIRIDRVRPNLGIYAQDQWTLNRLTMNLGVRYDYFRAAYPDQSAEPTQWVPIRREVQGRVAVRWQDISPRLGVSYDLFGSAKTAVKASAGRYVIAEGTNRATNINPLPANNTNARRWTDTNNDRVVQGDPFNPAANAELGPSTNLRFGQPASSLEYDQEWAFGLGERAYNWEFSGGLQHELASRVSLSAVYFRRIYGNFEVVDNRAVTAAAFDPFCVTTPMDARLPGGGGQQICGLYDQGRQVGQLQRVATNASNYGKQYEHWNGVDVTVNMRLTNLTVQGGVSTGKTVADNCDIVTKYPQVTFTAPVGGVWLTSGPSTPAQFCHIETPLSAQTQAKLLASYTLPWDIQLAGTFQSVPGTPIGATASFTSAQVASSLGRPLAAASVVNVPIVAPGVMYGDRVEQFDMRLAKTWSIRGARMQWQIDVYNLFNASSPTLVSSAYGATVGATAGAAWLVPQAILNARLVKFGVQITY